jgi:creatinine amidohydrolase
LLVSAVAEAIESSLPGSTLLVPTLWLGCSPHHHHWPGTISLAPNQYMDLIATTCKSLVKTGARKILLLNGHGGNELPTKVAMRDLKTHFRDMTDPEICLANYWMPAWRALCQLRTTDTGGFGHASESETSLMLYLAPGLVRFEKARDDGAGLNQGDLSSTGPPYLKHNGVYTVFDFHELTDSGVVGHARAASIDKGQRMFEAIVPALVDLVQDFAQG